MGVVCIVIAADSVHIGVDAFACIVAVAVESHTLPLCKRLNDLGFRGNFLNVEIDLALNAVEVIVYTAALSYDKGSRNSVQSQCKRESLLKNVLDVFDSVMSFSQRED